MTAESEALTRHSDAQAAGQTVDAGHAVGKQRAVRLAAPVIRAGAAQAAAPAGGTGDAAGAYDTAEHRDALIALVNEIRATLIAEGFMKGSA